MHENMSACAYKVIYCVRVYWHAQNELGTTHGRYTLIYPHHGPSHSIKIHTYIHTRWPTYATRNGIEDSRAACIAIPLFSTVCLWIYAHTHGIAAWTPTAPRGVWARPHRHTCELALLVVSKFASDDRPPIVARKPQARSARAVGGDRPASRKLARWTCNTPTFIKDISRHEQIHATIDVGRATITRRLF